MPPLRPTREQIKRAQREGLDRMMRLAPHAPFWWARFVDAGIDPEHATAADFVRLPTTTKADLVADHAAHPPYGTTRTERATAYPRFHQTSGTTGVPMRWPDTPAGWAWVTECWAKIFTLVGTPPGEPVFFPFSFGPFLGFWAAFEGAARRGNMAIPAGGMSTEARLRMLANVEATTVCCTPTYALRMAEVAAAEGLELASLPVERLIVAGEPGGNVAATRERIELAWNADCYDHWGMTEVGPLATAVEGDKDALYVLETDCVAEILRREADEPVDAGEVGELVVTNLGRLGSPVLRYRTGDLVRAATTPSPVGLEFLRLEGGVLGRVDDMLTVRGNNVFPSAIEAVVRRFDGVAEYRVVVTESTSLTELRVDLEPAPDADATSIARDVGRALAETLNFRIAVAAVPADSLPRFEMKGKRVVREQSED